MTAAADRIFTDARVHTLTDADESAKAVAVRDGEIVRVGSAYEVAFLEGVDTDVIELDGRVLVPGFVDAHTHLALLGHYRVDADLSTAGSPGDCRDELRGAADAREEWILGFGYDESGWDDAGYLTREDLDAVSERRPVAAFREDLHLVSLNSEAFERVRESVPDENVHTADGEPTGVLTEAGTDAVWDAVGLTRSAAADLLVAAQERAHAVGITTVHDMVRRRPIPRAYHDLERRGDLTLRVRLNYWDDYLDAFEATGLAPNHGSDRLRTGAIKTYCDGSIGSRTAKLSEPYADAGGEDDEDPTGQWLRTPEDLRAFAERVDDGGLQAAVHAIGDEAIEATLDAFEDADGRARHRIEHAEVLTGDLIEQLGDSDLVVSAQPNFLKWAREDGLYDARLGVERRESTNRFADLLDAGAHLAFGSDCMPLSPLFGIQQAVTAPRDGQRLSVTEAMRAYTRGSAYAGFDEERLGTVEVGKRADFAILARSPWEVPDEEIADIAVEMTVVDGEIVADSRDGTESR
ncbi:amidohydrolase [Halorientalis salina]|uniref:amidohydrolase n=1 Tax=Halorientalis salina TaxID=2932266 RepID=UPI0010AB786B|nr:amidohydrolase [Halorientalis salina]